ncbi:baculoviral IAP repeat-containing protein 7-B-like [Styela clava]
MEKHILNHRKLRNSFGPDLPISDCSQSLRGHFDIGNELESNEDDDEDGIAEIGATKGTEADGIRHENAVDPPGQGSVYIPSGDHWNEDYRLATFAKFPIGSAVYPADLASSGFYYTGHRDRVKCFSCGIAVENWIIGDDGRDPVWHTSDCLMVNGRAESNVPREFFRYQTFLPQRQMTNNTGGTGVSNSASAARHHQWHSVAQQPFLACSASIQVADDLSTDRYAHPRNMPNQQQEFEELRLGEIHSEEHERLIFSLDLRNEEHRRKTFAKWPSHPAPELPAKLAAEGFFYLGNLDRAQCFSCSGILRNWTRNDEPRREHRKHFPNCKIITGIETRNIPMTDIERQRIDFEEKLRLDSLSSEQEPANPTSDEQLYLENHFKCLHPLNPHMQNIEDRIASFGPEWPGHRLKATVRSIANAGFFYLGQGDRTKCFYCNGGLQNWDEGDEPWTEHAKWFPGCEYVLRRKGVNLVKRLLEEHPNIRRPIIRNHCSYDIPPPPVGEHVGVAQGPPVPIPAFQNPKKDTAQVLRNLQSERICKGCSSQESDHLCMPCSHLSLCSRCAATNKKCPTCNTKIGSTIKIFRT